MPRVKKPTVTTLITEYLRRLDDFADAAMIREATGADSAHVSAALIHLYAHRVVDFVTCRGKSWWFALPPERDDRLRVINEIVDGIRHPNRRPRKKETLDAPR